MKEKSAIEKSPNFLNWKWVFLSAVLILFFLIVIVAKSYRFEQRFEISGKEYSGFSLHIERRCSLLAKWVGLSPLGGVCTVLIVKNMGREEIFESVLFNDDDFRPNDFCRLNLNDFRFDNNGSLEKLNIEYNDGWREAHVTYSRVAKGNKGD